MAHWWEGYPWRMIQTNLREIDMMDISAEEYVKDLQDFGATVVLLNAAGIIASYDTELEFQPRSAYLHGDPLQRILDRCHEAGIRVIARTDFSKIREEVFEKRPEWAYRKADGSAINYNGDIHTCLNGAYQQEYLFEIVEEVLNTHSFDGIFCNMSGFKTTDYSGMDHGFCHCQSCQEKFQGRYGMPLPQVADIEDPAFQRYLAFKEECESEHKAKLYCYVKAIDPEIAVNGFDYMRCESNTEIGRPQWQYSASSNARAISGAGRARPADNASVDFMGFRYRDISVSPALMELRQWQNLAGAGSVSLYIMGTLRNHADTSAFEPTKKVFQFHKRHERELAGLVSAARVVVMRESLWGVDDEMYGWIRALTESHIPFDELFLKELKGPEQLIGKDVVVLANMRYLPDVQAGLLDSFVSSGGTVIATGQTGLYDEAFEKRSEMALRCLGVERLDGIRHGLMSSMLLVGEQEREVFPHCDGAPYIAIGTEMVQAKMLPEAKGYLKLIPEHPFGPPERCYYTEVTAQPGVTVYPYGKGKGVYIPWMAGAFYRREGYQNTLNLMRDVLFGQCGMQQLAAGLTPMVELSIYKKGETRILQLVNNSGCFANSYFEPLPVHQIKLQLPGWGEKKARTLNGGVLKTENQEGALLVELDLLEHYEAILLE